MKEVIEGLSVRFSKPVSLRKLESVHIHAQNGIDEDKEEEEQSNVNSRANSVG